MRRGDWLIGQLPMGMMEDDFFVRFASLFQELASSLLDGADNIPNVVDPSVAPAPLVRWLGSWIGVTNIDSSLPVEVQRRMVRQWGQILAWRGTRRGLVAFLELMTGGAVEVWDSGGVFVAGEAGRRPPHVRMRVESTGWVPEEDFVKVVDDELPANVTFELFVRDRRVWPPPGVQFEYRAAGDEFVTAAVRQEEPPVPLIDHDEEAGGAEPGQAEPEATGPEAEAAGPEAARHEEAGGAEAARPEAARPEQAEPEAAGPEAEAARPEQAEPEAARPGQAEPESAAPEEMGSAEGPDEHGGDPGDANGSDREPGAGQ